MSSNTRNVVVFAATSLVLLSALALLEALIGSGADELHLLLRVSGRTSLLIFLLVFVARPLHQLRVAPSSQILLKNRRYFGIAFASSHTVHLGMILWLVQTVPEESFDLVTVVVGGGGYILLYLMLLTSFDRPARALGPVAWRRLHKLGLYWIGFIFAVDFFVKPFSQPSILPYVPFSVLAFLAFAIRVAAWRAQRRDGSAHPVRSNNK